MIFCCDKNRHSNYCSECGRETNIIGNLLAYLKRNADEKKPPTREKWERWYLAVKALHENKVANITTLHEAERETIEKALVNTGGNRRKAAKLLDIGERTLYRKIKEYD